MFVLSENHFRKCECLVGLENRIFRKLISVDRKKKGFDYGNEFPFLFSLQMNSGERERERERKKRPLSSSPVRRSPANPELQSAPIARTNRSCTAPRYAAQSHAPDDRTVHRSQSREASITISLSTAPSNPVDRDLAPRRTSQSSVDR